ncbi:hypothetical protein [Bacillus coahuilensis]|nr:hypothetical protein [Bacillus coahuilensis]
MADKVSSTRWFGLALQALIVLANHDGVCPSSMMAEKLNSQSTFYVKY